MEFFEKSLPLLNLHCLGENIKFAIKNNVKHIQNLRILTLTYNWQKHFQTKQQKQTKHSKMIHKMQQNKRN